MLFDSRLETDLGLQTALVAGARSFHLRPVRANDRTGRNRRKLATVGYRSVDGGQRVVDAVRVILGGRRRPLVGAREDVAGFTVAPR